MPAAPQPKRHYRIDPGDGRIVAAAIGSMHSTHPPQRPHSFAARLFHWHAALAPHAGVALTFFLALTAGLLYWRTLGPAAPAPLQPAASPLAWANEYAPPTAAESPAPVNQWQAPTPTYTPPEMSWPLAPRVTLDAAPLSAAMAEPPTLDSVESLARDLSAEAGDDSPAVHQPAVDGDITPTPASPAPATSTLAYPSTPFALIDPSAIRPEDIAEIAAEQQAPAPAEGSTEGASLPGSPR